MTAQGRSVLVVAGEASGDMHAAGLIQRLKQLLAPQQVTCFGSGGERLAELDVELFVHISQLAAIGPAAALSNMGSYWKLYRKLLSEAATRKPDLALLVDFPEFNLILARRLKAMGIPVCYFISPQLWAWRSSRIKKIRRYVDLMLVILPFEEEFFRNHGVRSFYVGNPIARIRDKKSETGRRPGQSLQVALLPGSRSREVEQIFPVQLDTAAYISRRTKAGFLAVEAPTLPPNRLVELYRAWSSAKGTEIPLEFSRGESLKALSQADCAIVKSGTSTLEAAILGTPFAMIYRMPFLSWAFARLFVETKTYCLANIVAGRRIVEEFVQRDATAERIGKHMVDLLDSPERREEMRRRLLEASRRLGDYDAYGEAAQRVAEFIAPEEEAA